MFCVTGSLPPWSNPSTRGYPETVEDAELKEGLYHMEWMSMTTFEPVISMSPEFMDWYSMETFLVTFTTDAAASRQW